jgi:F-type H+-transporting ATPase subunit delta
MADTIELARRYAGALFESIGTDNDREKILAELRDLRVAFGEPSIREFFASPMQSKEAKRKVLSGLNEKLGLTKLSVEFLDFLIERHRFEILTEVISSFEKSMDAAGGLIRGDVLSVRPLAAEEREALRARISGALGKKIILEYKVDPSLIGGLVARVGSYKFDDSLDTQLHVLGEALKRRSH